MLSTLPNRLSFSISSSALLRRFQSKTSLPQSFISFNRSAVHPIHASANKPSQYNGAQRTFFTPPSTLNDIPPKDTPLSLSKQEAEFHINHTMKRMKKHPLILCIRESSPNSAYAIAKAALSVAPVCIEVTLTTPEAFKIIDYLRLEYPKALVGAGTVFNEDEVREVHRAGGSFIMSPVADGQIIQKAHEYGLLAIPGAYTPTEIHTAYHKYGARVVKVFPIHSCGGSTFIRSVGGPLGHIPLLPTSGVSYDELDDYFQLSNLFAVGISKQQLDKSSTNSLSLEENIKEEVKKWLDVTKKYR